MRTIRLLRDKRGVVVPFVVTMITLIAILIVGLLIVANLHTTANNMDLGSTGNATRNTLFGNIYTAFNLSVLLPIIAAAGLIISAIFYYFKTS